MKQILKQFLRKFIIKIFPELKILLRSNINFDSSTINNSTISETAKLYPPYHISDSIIGNYTYISRNSFISLTNIGNFCSIGPNFLCGWGIHPTNGVSTHPMFYSTRKQNGLTLSDKDKVEERAQITIGHDVFIGANVTILDGVTIGTGAVIGAGAVVTKDIPEYAIAVGVPAKVKKYRFDPQTIKELLASEWFLEEDLEKLKTIEKYLFDVKKFLKHWAKLNNNETLNNNHK